MARSARHAFPNFSGDHYSSVTWGIVTVAIDLLGHYAETPMWRLDETAREAIRRGLRALLVEQKSQRPSRNAVCSAARTIGQKIRLASGEYRSEPRWPYEVDLTGAALCPRRANRG